MSSLMKLSHIFKLIKIITALAIKTPYWARQVGLVGFLTFQPHLITCTQVDIRQNKTPSQSFSV